MKNYIKVTKIITFKVLISKEMAVDVAIIEILRILVVVYLD